MSLALGHGLADGSVCPVHPTCHVSPFICTTPESNSPGVPVPETSKGKVGGPVCGPCHSQLLSEL